MPGAFALGLGQRLLVRGVSRGAWMVGVRDVKLGRGATEGYVSQLVSVLAPPPDGKHRSRHTCSMQNREEGLRVCSELADKLVRPESASQPVS